tara:strand:+ start:2184 stop:3032 length:849 start_codon:yes stop_codon:yes gene_type:complete
MFSYPFWVNDFDRVRDHRQTHPEVAEIFKYPVAFWYGAKKGKKAYTKLESSLKRFLNRTAPQLPYFVMYNLPNRDLGHYSKGGAESSMDYLIFLEEFCKGIQGHKPIVIFEPDALPHTTHMTPTDAQYRINLIKEGIRTITDNSDCLLYIDIGHSNWLSPEQAGELLNSVSNSNVRGFSVNVSNYRTTEECMKWALKVSEYNEDWHFVIDTSRNGAGPHGNDWCNPPGRSLGIPPTCDTGNEKCDAFLWIKIPGESDGKGNGGPRAGRFWSEMGSELVKNTN